MLVSVLLLADDQKLQDRLRAVVEPLDVVVSNPPASHRFWLEVSNELTADVILVDHQAIPQPVAKSVGTLRQLPNQPEVIVIWHREDPEERARLLIAGCFAVLHAALSDETLAETMDSLIARRRDSGLDRLQRQIAESDFRLTDFESESPVMRGFLNMVRRVVEPSSSLLLLGETGVGKERLARAIHAESPRGQDAFIPVNCAAFPEGLLEGELFGHEEGAFTGATGDRRGYFELSHGGTIFLDEIGELPRHLQVKLLRVLQERTIQRLGSEESIAVDVRVMAATNRDLEQEISDGRFRRDLFYRLSVVALEIPPLRKHPEDIPAIVERYLVEFRHRLGRNVVGISPEAMDMLRRYEWPGNVRELINVVERAVILCEGDQLVPADLPITISGRVPPELAQAGETPAAALPGDWVELPWSEVRRRVVEVAERQYLTEQLKITRGRLVDISERSGISSRALFEMMKRLGLRKEDYRRRRR